MTVILARLTVHVFGNDCDLRLEFESRNGQKPCNDYKNDKLNDDFKPRITDCKPCKLQTYK